MSPAAPGFVDDSGRRRALTRRAVRILFVGFAGYLALLAVGFARDPHLGALGLPTFGLPGLVHSDPPPTVLGESTARTPAETATAGADATRPAAAKPGDALAGIRPATPGTTPTTAAARATTTPTGRGGPAPAAAPPASAPPATTSTTTAPSNGHGHGTTTTTSTTTSSTTTTTAPTSTPGPGSSSSGASSGKGPDGTGAPGQARRPTTTTTSPGSVG